MQWEKFRLIKIHLETLLRWDKYPLLSIKRGSSGIHLSLIFKPQYIFITNNEIGDSPSRESLSLKL